MDLDKIKDSIADAERAAEMAAIKIIDGTVLTIDELAAKGLAEAERVVGDIKAKLKK